MAKMTELRFCAAALFAGLSLAGAVPVAAHDLRGLMSETKGLDDATIAKLKVFRQRVDAEAKEAIAAKNAGKEGVVERAKIWQKSKITVCFFDGGNAAREAVATTARKWTEGTGVSFDFGPAGRRHTCDGARIADIRVTFHGDGNWSMVGTEAATVPRDKPTLALSGFGDVSALTEDAAGTILHEFGHALGFQHEHQSPQLNCNTEFDWTYLYEHLGWPKPEVDFNMRQLLQSSSKDAYFATAFDRDSIMLYSLSARAFVKGAASKCYIPRKNNTLSPLDRVAIAKMYPQQVGNRTRPRSN
jgi:hypothetical protein